MGRDQPGSETGSERFREYSDQERQRATSIATACDTMALFDNSSRLLTKRELASYLAVSVRTVERLLKTGLPSVLVAGIRRFDRVEVMGWLRKKENHG